MEKMTVKKRGQSLILVAFAIFALIGFVGLGIDLGMTYIARVRIRRAVDAAALAAASELPLERIAHVRALEYLAENQYDCGLDVGDDAAPSCTAADARVEINATDVVTNGRQAAYAYVTGPDAEAAEYVIQIDTSEFADVQDGGKQLDSATRIRVGVSENVDLYFMKVLGFDSVPIYASAVAENISDLDVVLVFDKSGSMEFDTRCYGCWTSESDKEYPDGTYWFLPWDDDDGDGVPTHCEGSDPYEEGGDQYIVIEAEDYSRLSNAYQRDLVDIGQTYWVLGRNGSQANSWMGRSGSYMGRDSYDAYIAYAPARTHDGADGTGVPCFWDDISDTSFPGYPADRMCSDHAWVVSQGGPFPSPRVDYDFSIPEPEAGEPDEWYIWVRAKGGGSNDGASVEVNDETVSHHWFFWGLSQDNEYELKGREYPIDPDGSYTNGAVSGGWGWYVMGTGKDDVGTYALSPGDYTLHIWGGSPGVDIDRIVISTYDDITSINEERWSGNEHGIGQDLPLEFESILEDESAEIFDNNRTGWACDPCDARYGGRPDPAGDGYPDLPVCQLAPPLEPGETPEPGMAPQPNRYEDDLWDDEQPIRASVEAAKGFVRKLNPRFDQVGLVTYSSSASIRSKLQCVRRLGRDNCDMDVLENTVIDELDGTHAKGGTNIAEGIEDGITVLSNIGDQYGRPAAAHIMILMTDGEANTGSCGSSDDWPNDDERAKDCVIVRAREARNNGIVIYTITLGEGADIELLSHVADMTGGIHRHAPSPEQLEPIFDELYSRIFLRIVE